MSVNTDLYFMGLVCCLLSTVLVALIIALVLLQGDLHHLSPMRSMVLSKFEIL